MGVGMRRVLAWLLLFPGLLALTAAVPAVWADRTLLDTDNYTEIVGPVIDEPEVKQALTARMTSALLDQAPLLTPARSAIETQLERLVASEGFVDTWWVAVRLSHEHTLAAVRNESTSLNLEESRLTVELAPLIAELKPRLAEAGVPLTDLIPEVEASFVLLDTPALGQGAKLVRWIDDWSTRLLVGGLSLLGVGVLVSSRKARDLMLAGAGATVLMALLYALVTWARHRYLSTASDALIAPGTARVVFDTLTLSLRTTVASVGAAGLLTALGAWVLQRTRRRTAR